MGPIFRASAGALRAGLVVRETRGGGGRWEASHRPVLGLRRRRVRSAPEAGPPGARARALARGRLALVLEEALEAGEMGEAAAVTSECERERVSRETFCASHSICSAVTAVGLTSGLASSSASTSAHAALLHST